jgi:hypothetical protein
MRAEHREYLTCPTCDVGEWRVDQCAGHTTFGPWSCSHCQNYFKFVRNADEFEIVPVEGPEGRNTPVTVTLRSVTVPPITLKLNTWKYGHSQKDTLEDYTEHQRYFYNEHICPTNWVSEIEEIEFEGDHDPHGVFKFVSVEDGHFEDPSVID